MENEVINTFVSLKIWGSLWAFSGFFASIVQLGRGHVGMGALPWHGCHSAPEPFLGYNFVRFRTSCCSPSLFCCFCKIFWEFFDHLFYFFQCLEGNSTRQLYPTAFSCYRFFIFVPGFAACFLNMGVPWDAALCCVSFYIIYHRNLFCSHAITSLCL